MTDNRCADVLAGKPRTAERYDTPRALRLVLADVRDDDDATAQIKAEIGNCPECWRGIASVLAGMVSGIALSQAEGNNDLVEEKLAQELAAILDDQ